LGILDQREKVPMKLVTIGDCVRVKATGELMVVEGKTEIDNKPALVISKWGHMSGGQNIPASSGPRLEVKREDVVKVVARTEWVDDED
jgi:hypothetical protein